VAIQISLWAGASSLSAEAECAAVQNGADSTAVLYTATVPYASSVICVATGCDGCSAKHKWNVDGYHRQNSKVAVVRSDPKWTGHQVNSARRYFSGWLELER